jgi:ABC-type uncharacterized transport system involved in gliding motility auxiliary subunit
VLAAHVTGDIATAFPDGRPGGAANGAEALKQSAQPANIVVVADTDLLDDRFWAQTQNFYGRRVVEPIANNADFVANAVEALAGGQDLIGLRSRGTVARPFEVVERIQRTADARYAAEQRSLENKLKQAQAKLHSITTTGEGGANTASVTADQAKEIEKFRADMLATRQQLRQVQAALRQDIERLKIILVFFNIALMPIVVVAAAFVVAALRARRRDGPA